jgi:hypothetical protein
MSGSGQNGIKSLFPRLFPIVRRRRPIAPRSHPVTPQHDGTILAQVRETLAMLSRLLGALRLKPLQIFQPVNRKAV